MKRHFRELVQEILEPYRYRFPWLIRSFLDKHELLRRKEEFFQVPLIISYYAYNNIELTTRNNMLSEELIRKFWTGIMLLIKHGYYPYSNTISIMQLSKTGDTDAIKMICNFRYRGRLLEIGEMQALIDTTQKVALKYFFQGEVDTQYSNMRAWRNLVDATR